MPISVYACKNKDLNVRINSTSGGVFSLLANRTIELDGVVYGAEFDVNSNVVCSRHEDLQGICKLRGSKYPQQDMGDSFRLIKKDLAENRKVLFTGTPCQVFGLRKYLNRDYDNLLCVDFTCMGVGSPKLWTDYLDSYFDRSRINKIVFKDKLFGWHNWTTVVMSDKRISRMMGIENPYMYMYLEKLIMRPSCTECFFKGDNRASDFTISDCWGIERYYPEFDDNAGVSCLFVNTNKGSDIFKKVRDLMEIQCLTVEQATARNPYYFNCVKPANDRTTFINSVEQYGLRKAIRNRRKMSLFRRLYSAIKIKYRQYFRSSLYDTEKD